MDSTDILVGVRKILIEEYRIFKNLLVSNIYVDRFDHKIVILTSGFHHKLSLPNDIDGVKIIVKCILE